MIYDPKSDVYLGFVHAKQAKSSKTSVVQKEKATNAGSGPAIKPTSA